MSAPWLTIIGINEDGHLPPLAIERLAAAELVMGGARHLALAAHAFAGETRPWPSPIADAIPILLAYRPRPVAVLASGDPMWFGIGATILRHVAAAETTIIPAPSSFALASARLGWPLHETACLSCCGRPVSGILPHLHDGARLLVLSADAATPATIAALLSANGFGASDTWLLEALGGPNERIRRGLPPDPAPLNIVAILARGAAPLPVSAGLDDALFEHDGQITKREIRALTLSALAPRPGQLLWDIGCGSGSVAIEWMRSHPACRAVGLEARPERAARARRNAEALGLAFPVTEAAAPEALAGLPPPHAIFLGGGGHLPGVIDAAWAALPPGGRIVANAIALRTEAALAAAQARHGGALLRIGLERLDSVGAMQAFRPAMTVTQWSATR